MHWRKHPGLDGKLHPQHPDDLQVVVHDGGPRLSKARPEAVWVSITALEGNVFEGRVLNEPNQLTSVKRGQSIQFLVDTGTEHAVMVTGRYLLEKARWKIAPCTKCGFTELFDAPSDLVKATFPNVPADAQLEGFTAFCALCGGVQTIESVAAPFSAERRPWWKFWSGR